MRQFIFPFFSLFLILLSVYVKAQDSTKYEFTGNIGISYSSFGDNKISRNDPLIGEASYNSVRFFTIGIHYNKELYEWLDIETGVKYSKHTIRIDPVLYPPNDYPSYTENFSLINIPINLRANFLKYFFINGGPFLELDPSISSSIDSQTGIGFSGGLGVKYDFNFGVSLFVNPYLKFHALFPFSGESNQQKIYESALRVGISYDLGSRK